LNVFQAVKQAVSTRQAAESYGFEVRHNGMTCCPFHSDRNPSMKVDNRFHCFGCGEDGDVIDFTAKLFGVGLKEAAQRLASDFGISYDNAVAIAKPSINQKLKAVQEKQAEQQCFNTLCDYYKLLVQHKSEYAPRSESEELHPYFIEALQNMSYAEYLLDLMTYGTKEERTAFVYERGKEVKAIEQRIKQFTKSDRAEHICL
jgi:hypothetical protein